MNLSKIRFNLDRIHIYLLILIVIVLVEFTGIYFSWRNIFTLNKEEKILREKINKAEKEWVKFNQYGQENKLLSKEKEDIINKMAKLGNQIEVFTFLMNSANNFGLSLSKRSNLSTQPIKLGLVQEAYFSLIKLELEGNFANVIKWMEYVSKDAPYWIGFNVVKGYREKNTTKADLIVWVLLRK